jgi:hypothetical protein
MRTVALLTALLPAQIGAAQAADAPAQSAFPTVHVGTEFVLLDALVENKKWARFAS